MKLSLKATYGILASVELVLHNGHAPVSARAIAQRQDIPPRFLEQVLHGLKRAGVIASHRGAQGGYALSRKPADVSLAEIIQALDGPIDSERRQSPGSHVPETRSRRESVLLPVVEQLQEAELTVLRSVTLADLAERQQAIEQEHALMYHI